MMLLKSIILMVSFHLVLGGGGGDEEIECYPNQTIHYTNLEDSIYTHFTAFYEADNGTQVTCESYQDPDDDVYFDCHSSTATLTVHIYYENFTTVYTFQCTPEANLTDSLVTVSANQTHKYADPTYNISAKFVDELYNPISQAQVGDTVYFVITGPKEYSLIPLECNATGGSDQYKTIITNGCTEDDSLISSFTVEVGEHETDYNATICVFKFHDSDDLAITCNIKVCGDAGCDFSCADRKRRGTSYSDVDAEFVVTSAVGNHLKVIG